MSLYRCADCGHGRNLDACAQAVSVGPLGADGQLIRHDDVADCFVFVDSIQCRVHPGGQIQKKVGSRFCVWVRCDSCDDEPEKLRARGHYGPCVACGGTGGSFVVPELVA